MKNNYILFFIIINLLSSCAFFKKTAHNEKMSKLASSKTEYNLVDKSGKFDLIRESGFVRAKNQYITKRQVYSTSSERKLLEKSIVISNPGNVNGVNLLRPNVSQYTVWFEKQKYFTEMKLSSKDKSMKIKMISPEKQWKGEISVKFPKMTGVYCYFSQIIDCANISGFIDEATKRQAGSMKMLIIWEGYPYFQEQYLNVPKEIFSDAVLEYDGKNKNGSRRFTLKFSGQSIFYFINKKNQFSKLFWVSQGLSQTVK